MIALLQLMMICVFSLQAEWSMYMCVMALLITMCLLHDVKWGKYTNDIVASTCFVAFVVLAHIWVLDTGEEED